MKKKTALIHGGIPIDPATGALSLPISQASTFRQKTIGDFEYEYARTGNPTREGLEKLIQTLEGGDRGFAFASGMAAIHAIMELFQAGDHLIVTDDVYGGTYRLFTKVLASRNIEVSFVDTSDIEKIEESLQSNTKAIFIETPTNPLLKISSLPAIGALADEKEVLFIVDNTFSTSYFQTPIDFGADIVLHSATKYLGGHSDVVAGLVVTKDKALSDRLSFIQNATGGVLGPNDSWLLIRGMKTLGLRMDAIESNARRIADFLSRHDAVAKVYYPGLTEHPDRDIHEQQSEGFGGMISFVLKNEQVVDAFLSELTYFTLAESLGAVESLVSVPSRMTHASIPRERRLALGIRDGLIRLSVGIEDVNDLVDDLNNALKRSGKIQEIENGRASVY